MRCSSQATKLIVSVSVTSGSTRHGGQLRGADEPLPRPVRGDIGRLVTSKLLANCKPPLSDIHDPSMPNTRSRSRDKQGFNRSELVMWDGEKGKHNLQRTRLSEWDTAPFADYIGRWCDRLLLGDPAQRCAVLEAPPSMALLTESVTRVLRSHPLLRAEDVLVVRHSSLSELGSMKFEPLSCDVAYAQVLREWLKFLAMRKQQQNDLCVNSLVIGTGSEAPLVPFSGGEMISTISPRVVPLGAFACAFWVSDPMKASAYLVGDPSTNLRLWRTMQQAMLSTRDAAVLEAHAEGKSVSRNLRGNSTAYQAERIIERERRQHGVRGRW